MPYFSIETNQPLDEENHDELLKKTSAFVADLIGKPEKWVMVSIKPDTAMIYNGDKSPLAFVQLKSIGLPTDRCGAFSSAICDFLQKEFNIPPDRIYIDFKDIERKQFGWNGGTF